MNLTPNERKAYRMGLAVGLLIALGVVIMMVIWVAV